MWIALFLVVSLVLHPTESVDTGLCVINLNDKVFSLNFIASQTYYLAQQDGRKILWNFCTPFAAPAGYNCTDAFSMVLEANYSCQSYSSDSHSALYNTSLYQQNSSVTGVVINLNSAQPTSDNSKNYSTRLVVKCGAGNIFQKQYIKFTDNATLEIVGTSSYGCPMIQMNQIWKALQENSIIFGLILFSAGILELFFGRKLLQPTIFIAAYCLSFVILAAISSIFLTPYTPMPYVYICLLVIIILSSVLAYFALSFTYISVFLIGAYLGFIVAILLNSLLIKLFGYTSNWPLIVLSVLLCLILGYLSYRIHDHIIIVSTSFNGAYMVIRPISWIFGGFPNQFLVAEMLKAQQISSLPSVFFLYLFLILVLAVIGINYQYLKYKRESNDVLQISRGEEIIQNSVDAIRNSINQIIDKYKKQDSDDEGQNQKHEIQFTEMRKVPLYPDLNDDRESNSEMIRQGLLDKLEYGVDDHKSSEKQSPKVVKQQRLKSNEEENEIRKYNSERNSGRNSERNSSKTDDKNRMRKSDDRTL